MTHDKKLKNITVRNRSVILQTQYKKEIDFKNLVFTRGKVYIPLQPVDGGSWEYWDIENLFRNRKIVAVDAGDLVTTSYLCTHSDHITVRWVGRHYGYSDTVDVEAKLYNNGNIKINLKSIGVMNGNWPGYGVTGVSRGDITVM